MPAELIASQVTRPLTPRRQRFCAEYVIDFKASQALLRATGNKIEAAGARVTACRWLKEPAVQAEIERLKGERLEELGVTAFGILSETAAIAHSNALDFLPAIESGDLSKLTRHQAAAIKKLTIEEFEDKPQPPAQPVTLEPQPQGGALQRGSNPETQSAESKPKLKRRIMLELAPKTPALDLLGRHKNLWGRIDPDAPGAGATNVQVNVIFDL